MNLSEQIRQAREAKGLSQEALAEQLGLSRQAVSKWELGASCPSPENLEALGNILEADFSGSSAPEPPEAPKKRRLWLWGLVLLSCALLAFLFSAPEPAALSTILTAYDVGRNHKILSAGVMDFPRTKTTWRYYHGNGR